METNTVVPFGAAPKRETFGDVHDGNIVSVADDRLVMSSLGGKEYSFRVAPDAVVGCDGLACKAEELKVGSKIRLTTKTENKNVVIEIESLNVQTEFAERTGCNAKADGKQGLPYVEANTKREAGTHSHEGTVVSITGNKLVTNCLNGKEHAHTVAADAMVTCDGTVCRTQDLKPGAKIRLTTKPDDEHIATDIESLQHHVKFAPSA